MRLSRRTFLAGGTSAAALGLANGCAPGAAQEVVVYCALDEGFARPILADFEQETGVAVGWKFDVESTKTVGLVNRIILEQKQPRCDLFWNNEILHTLRLERMGLLESYSSPKGDAYPDAYRSPGRFWHGFAARARVLIVNKSVPEAERPRSIRDLVDPRWKNQVALAKPLAGTTATHAAVLFARWGTDEATRFFRSLKENAHVLSGNKQVAREVAAGQVAFGLTDTDDAVIEADQGQPVVTVYPDQGADGEGTLFIPNSLALIKNGRHLDHARRLVDFLLSAPIEERLAKGESAQFPVSREVTVRSRAEPAVAVRWMDVDFAAAAAAWDEASDFLKSEFTR